MFVSAHQQVVSLLHFLDVVMLETGFIIKIESINLKDIRWHLRYCYVT